MKSEDEIRERINYLKQLIVEDVTNGIFDMYSLNYYKIAILTLKDVLGEKT